MHTIRFSDTQGNLLLSREYSADEASEFHRIEGALVGVDKVSIFKALVSPVLTARLNNFAKDLFLPTYLNYAITIDESVLKIFASIAAIAFDLLFLPVRLFTCPFRIIRNAAQPTHPLRVHLIVNGVNEQQQGDVVRVEVRSRTSTNRTLPRTPQDEADGVIRTERSTSSSNYSRWVNFIEIPDDEEYTRSTDGSQSSTSTEYEPVVLAT